MKTTNLNKKYLFKDKPIFGLDIGHDTIRVIQINKGKNKPKVIGYGTATYDSSSVKDGVLTKPEQIAKVTVNLFKKGLVGDISTNHVAVSLPTARTVTRAIHLPIVSGKDLDDAIKTEADQYMGADSESLYLDYDIVSQDKDGMEVFVVGVPKKIVDSYLTLMKLMGLETVLMDHSIVANARIFVHDKNSNLPSMLIDFGANDTDIAVYNKGLVVTGSVAFGGDNVTEMIARALRISNQEALKMKSEHGLNKSDAQKRILAAMEPSLAVLLKEIRRTMRYYEQRYQKESPISQVITMGGGANMPGLADYLTAQLRVPTRTFSPLSLLDFGHLKAFNSADYMSYVTAVGLAITDPNKVLK